MTGSARNVALYPWFKFLQSLLFWQATWFLFFQSELSAAEAILIYAIADIATTVLEVPSGYVSDRVGRRFTLIVAGVAGVITATMQAVGETFWVFAAAQLALGAHFAFVSGTDSSLLYESLDAEGRAGEIEAQEVRAWRFTFAGLMLSAVAGGAMALYSLRLPYVATCIAFLGLTLIVLRFTEPPEQTVEESGELARLGALRDALRQPVLLWLFVLTLLMYVFSHLPFVFGQPFILNALASLGLEGQAPLVSGVVTAVMMGLSILTSWLAPGLRARLGLPGILLLAFAMQIALAAVLALSTSVLVIALLFLRMVPDSFSRPFILARVQPLLPSRTRATYLSIKSLAGRLVFSATLLVASANASDVGEMSHDEMSVILGYYVAFGVLAFAGLVVALRGRGV